MFISCISLYTNIIELMKQKFFSAIVIDPIHSPAYNAASFIFTYFVIYLYRDIDSLHYHVPLLHFSRPLSVSMSLSSSTFSSPLH